MLKRLLQALVLAGSGLYGMERVQGDCERGAQKVVTVGVQSTTNVMASYPSCQITVYLTGTTTLATIYSDNSSTVKPNPFTADTNGHYFFYAADGRYAVRYANGGIVTPFTYSDVLTWDYIIVQDGVGTIPRSIKDKVKDIVSVRDYGALGDGATDDYAALNAAFQDAEGKCLFFPGGTYNISLYLNLLVSRVCLIGGPDVVINNTFPGITGYQNDGFRIGNASAQDGGTGVAINIWDVVVDGFDFTDTRIGVWGVYAQRVTIQNITSGSRAVVAIGNDADDDCRDIIVKNIIRTAPSSSDWYTVGFFNTQNFVLDGVISPYSVNAQAVPITTSRYGTVSNIVVDQQDVPYDCITLLDSKFITLSSYNVRNCRVGVLVYSGYASIADAEQYNTIGVGSVTSSQYGLHIYSRYNTVSGMYTYLNTVASVIIGTDSQSNTYQANNFSEGTYIDAGGVINNQKWISNAGIYEGIFQGNVGIRDTAPAYDLSIKGSVRSQISLEGDYSGGSTNIAGLLGLAGVRGGTTANKIVGSLEFYNTSSGSTTGGYIALGTRTTGGSTINKYVYVKEWAGIQLDGGYARVACTNAARGTIYYGAAGAGIADGAFICVKRSNDVYEWFAITVNIP